MKYFGVIDCLDTDEGAMGILGLPVSITDVDNIKYSCYIAEHQRMMTW